MARPDFRAAAARRLSEDRELPPAIVSLLSPEMTHRSTGVKVVPVDRIEPNPQNPRLSFEEGTLEELAASIREHGVLQPILLRPLGENRFELIAGERRWRASKLAGIDRHPRARRGDRRRHCARDLDHREPPAGGHLAARGSGDVRPDGQGARLQHPQARGEAGQGQGLSREPAAARRRAARDPRARVFAQGHAVPRLRADEGRGSSEAPEARRAGCPQRAVPGQASGADRGSSCASSHARCGGRS